MCRGWLFYVPSRDEQITVKTLTTEIKKNLLNVVLWLESKLQITSWILVEKRWIFDYDWWYAVWQPSTSSICMSLSQLILTFKILYSTRQLFPFPAIFTNSVQFLGFHPRNFSFSKKSSGWDHCRFQRFEVPSLSTLAIIWDQIWPMVSESILHFYGRWLNYSAEDASTRNDVCLACPQFFIAHFIQRGVALAYALFNRLLFSVAFAMTLFFLPFSIFQWIGNTGLKVCNITLVHFFHSTDSRTIHGSNVMHR